MSGYDQYVRGKVLGKGSFGQAVLVTHKASGKNYVIKEIDISRMPKAEREASEQEAKLLKALSHPNIVRCIECFTHQSKLCIVMDWCSEGDLYTICQKRRGAPLPEEAILDWFVQMCLGLKHVHDRKILHRDIKTQNIFMSAGGLLKLGDFGVSKILSSTWQLAATAVGTPYYLSPEICQNKRYNQKSDIWSLGCVLYELAAGKHAFEAPNMRALIQKIIKGQYPPVPSTRSRELRELIDRMLTLNWEKRPSINDVLSAPVIKARIAKFLSATLQAHEFSHTVIHGRPQLGQIVVQPKKEVVVAGNAPAQALAPSALQPKAPNPAINKPAAALNPAANVNNKPTAAAAAGKNPVSGQNGLPVAKVPIAGQQGGRPGSGANAAAAANAKALEEAAAMKARAQQEVAAAREKAAQAAKEREEAVAAAAVKRAEDLRRQRELAAVAAHREVERMKLEEQRKKIEMERARLESERKKVEAARQEAERKAKQSEEAARRAAAEDMRRRAEAEARKQKADEEARVKAAEKAAKERKREQDRAQIAAQRREYFEQREAAARNRAAVAAQDGPQVHVFDAPAPRQRKPWVQPEVSEPEQGCPEPAVRPVRKEQAPLTAEQRRAVWEEQRAAAERNRRAAVEVEQRSPGLAGFLGVPEVDQTQAAEPVHSEADVQAPRHRRQWDKEGHVHDPIDAYERRRQRLEKEAAARDAAIKEYQQQHWREMREAAARNRAAVMAELNNPDGHNNPSNPSNYKPDEAQQQPVVQAVVHVNGQPAEDDFEFAAMIKDMQDILVSDPTESKERDKESQKQAGVREACDDDDDDDDDGSDGSVQGDDPQIAALEGRFLLNGQPVALPVRDADSLALKVEALRCYLETQLGTEKFLKVYRRLESLSLEDDEEQVSKEFLAVLGPNHLPYLQLIHQLIVCEENLNSGA